MSPQRRSANALTSRGPYASEYIRAKERRVKHQCISVLAKVTLPFSGLNLSAGSGSIELKKVVNKAKGGREPMCMPDECINFIDSMLDLVIGVDGLDPQFENQSVELVYNECDLDTLLESVLYDFLGVHHGLV